MTASNSFALAPLEAFAEGLRCPGVQVCTDVGRPQTDVQFQFVSMFRGEAFHDDLRTTDADSRERSAFSGDGPPDGCAPAHPPIGGGTVGGGLEALYAANGIDLVSFDVHVSPHVQFVADAHQIPGSGPIFRRRRRAGCIGARDLPCRGCWGNPPRPSPAWSRVLGDSLSTAGARGPLRLYALHDELPPRIVPHARVNRL